MLSMEQLIRQIPKAELHLHIEGTLEPELMFALANRNNIKIPFKSVSEVHRAYHFQDLQSFLNLYYQGMQVLIHEQDYYDLTIAYLTVANEQQVRHAEIFFDPQAHTDRGIPLNVVISGINQALLDAKSKFNMTTHLIPCFLRDNSEDSAMKTLEQFIPFKETLIAVGLDSAEIGNPPEKFKDVFAKAIQHGFLTTAHAGEEGPPEYIWGSLKWLQVKRIDHGVKCVLDPKLVDFLKERQIPLTVCPISNIKLQIYKTMADHPLKKMLDAGLCVLVNSDDPAYFRGYVVENFMESQKALNLTQKDIYHLARNSFIASFLEEAEKQSLIKEVDEFFQLAVAVG